MPQHNLSQDSPFADDIAEEERFATRVNTRPISPVLHTDRRAANIFTTPIEALPSTVRASLRFADGRPAIVLRKTVFVIGRAADVCDLSFSSDSEVSRQHAAILFVDGEFFIEDLESTNGTFAGDNRVWRLPLKPDVPFHIGATTLMLHVD